MATLRRSGLRKLLIDSTNSSLTRIVHTCCLQRSLWIIYKLDNGRLTNLFNNLRLKKQLQEPYRSIKHKVRTR